MVHYYVVNAIIEKPPTLGKVIPIITISRVGSKVELQCISSSKPVWWIRRNSLEIFQIIERFTLILTNITISESERYYCNGTGLNKESFTSYGDVIIAGAYNIMYLVLFCCI